MEPFQQIVDETLAVWARTYEVCAGFGAALIACRGPADVFAAQATFVAESADIAASAAGLMLRQHGLGAPTLNEG